MPMPALAMALIVLPTFVGVGFVALVRPVALMRLMGATVRMVVVVVPRSLRDRVADSMRPWTFRLWGVAALVMVGVVGGQIVHILLTEGIDEAATSSGPHLALPFLAIGAAQLAGGLLLIVRARPWTARLRPRFARYSADLKAWMLIVLGSLAALAGGVSLWVGLSLA
jgi:hypothetical protein